MTLNDYAYKIWNLIRPRIIDDENLDIRDIKDWIVSQRALFLRNEFNKRRTIDDSLVQSLGCVELEVVGTGECPEFTGCTMLKTKKEIPVPIQLHNDVAITRVGYTDLTRKGFPLIKDLNELNVNGSGRFNYNQIYAIRIGNHIFLKLSNDNPMQSALKFINIRGVWEDPREVANFQEADGKTCYNDAITPFPINGWYEDYLEGAIVQYKANIALQGNTDPINDGEAIDTIVQNINQRSGKKG